MKRRFRAAIVLWLLVVQAFAPFAAYASTQPSPGMGDICSVYAKASGGLPGAPLPQTGHHVHSHCALCPGGAAFVALVPPAVPAFALTPGASIAPQSHRAAIIAAPMLSPPSRGPPRIFAIS
jgi:hypothetical protein